MLNNFLKGISMVNSVEIQEIEQLIAKGETEKALELAKVFLKDKDVKLYRECLILSNKYYEGKNDYLLNLVKDRESSAKIILGLLNIIKRIEHRDKSLNIRILNRIHKLTNTKPELEELGMINHVLASRTERLLGFLVEQLVLFLIVFMFATSAGLDIAKLLKEPITIQGIVIGTIMSGILGVIFYPIWSGNLGHKIMGLKVVEIESNRDYNIRIDGFKREALKSIAINLFIPILWLFFDSNNQNIYDKITKTIVVKKQN